MGQRTRVPRLRESALRQLRREPQRRSKAGEGIQKGADPWQWTRGDQATKEKMRKERNIRRREEDKAGGDQQPEPERRRMTTTTQIGDEDALNVPHVIRAHRVDLFVTA